MEVAALTNKTIKIKTKNTSFVINPTGKVDSEVFVFTEKPSSYSAFEGLIIDGPGEYEVAGVSIKGEKVDGKVSFDFLEENQKLLVLPTSASIKTSETEEYALTVVLLDQKVDPFISGVTSQVVALVGEDEFLPADTANLKKVDKINLKKTEEYKGSTIHLSK